MRPTWKTKQDSVFNIYIYIFKIIEHHICQCKVKQKKIKKNSDLFLQSLFIKLSYLLLLFCFSRQGFRTLSSERANLQDLQELQFPAGLAAALHDFVACAAVEPCVVPANSRVSLVPYFMEPFDPAELPELLKLYYRRLFPYAQYYRWLNYGGGDGGREGVGGESGRSV